MAGSKKKTLAKDATSSPARTGKRPYHHGNLREALLQAALQRLQGASRSELSLRDLARDVGVTVNAVYRHFADKDALLAAVAAVGFRRLATSQQTAVADVDAPRRRAFALGRDYVRFARANPALFRLMFTRSGRSDDDAGLAQAKVESFHLVLDSVAGLLSLPVDDARSRSAALAAWAVVHGLSQLALDGQIDHLGGDPMATVEAALRAVRFEPAPAAVPQAAGGKPEAG